MPPKKPEILYLKGVGPKRAAAFEKLGLKYADDLFTIYPRDYLLNISIRDLARNKDKNVLIHGKIIDRYAPKKPKHPTRLAVYDGNASIECLVWGNTFYREKQFKLGDEYIFWGKVNQNPYDRKIQFDLRDHKKFEAGDDEMLKYPLIPVYILSGELKKTWVKPLTLTKIIFNALKNHSGSIKEIFPDKIRNEYGLLGHKDALLRTHFPHSLDDIETARQTLAFEELFFLQLVMALRKKFIETAEKGISLSKIGDNFQKLFSKHLGFELTGAQKRVIKEIYRDMRSGKPMNRLLQGDVGSGKTIVAVFCMLIAIENGYQCAFMCPTEILAEQHYKTLAGYFEKLGVRSVILTGGQKKKLRDEILHEIRSGKAQVVVGTHALIQETVEFKNLGFAVIDEQHKFGVMQRAKLRAKGLNPDVLVMTATPIPRTLSLTVYGDLDVSVIDELPADRKSIKTGLRYEHDRDKVYHFIRDEIKKGRQAYIVYPIIEESEKTDLKSAVKHYEILSKHTFADLRLGLVHGRLFWYEIDETIEAFKNRKINILVSTTVIEVGIDIPNATIMVIEEAQRFGLSQLHQLRGRVGRGAEQSYCILMANISAKNMDGDNTNAEERLKIMTDTTDGFKIAETDMKLRGPGEFFGTRQSGEFKFSAADLSKDMPLIEKARAAAFSLIENDPELQKPENESVREHFLINYKDSMNLVKVA